MGSNIYWFLWKKIKTFIEKEFPKEKNIIYIIFWIWILFLVASFVLSSTFESKYEWLWKINPGTWGDSFWGINSLISLITFFLVYKTFWLQKDMLTSQEKELKETKEEMRWQKETMRDQKLQTMVISLLELSRNHLIEFKDTLEKSKFCTPNGKDLISLYIQNNPNISQDSKDWILNNAIFYFRTLKYIEQLIINESLWDIIIIKTYINLLESQITENLRTLHGLLIDSKEWVDKNLITFKYLFNNKSIHIDNPRITNRRTVKVL